MSALITATRARQVLAGMVLLALVTACGSDSDESTPPASTDDGTFTPADVDQATDGRVAPVYAVPKSSAGTKLGFLNPGLSVPTFAEWQNGMEDAAEFYGVELEQADLDLKTDNIVAAYETLAVKGVEALGGGAGRLDDATIAAAEADDVPTILLDQTSDGVPSLGIDDQQAGQSAAEALVKAVEPRLESDWADSKIIYLGLSAANCVPCDARTEAGAEVLKTELGLTDDDVFNVAPDPGTADRIQVAVTDFLTAHPDEKILALGFAPGALTALSAAGREQDALVAGLGGDEVDRAALVDPANAEMFAGSVDFNPYAEGWNWVEAALATLNGESFEPYEVSNFLTPANVTDYYPEG